MLLWCLQNNHCTALGHASKNGHIDVVKHLMEHKADVNDVNTALIDGLFLRLIVLMLCDAAVVSAA